VGAVPRLLSGRIAIGLGTCLSWVVEHRRGPAGALHLESAELLAELAERTVRVLEAERPAIVLGGHQDAAMFPVRGEWEIARRRSGGGAVLVGGGRVLWVDILIPPGDPLWDDDVRKASFWIGDMWARALTVAGLRGAEVWRGALRTSPWSPWWCFAGMGPGECAVRGKKVVGVSQRRSRTGALFQTAALLRWDAEEHEALAPVEQRPSTGQLSAIATGVGDEVAAALLTAVLGVIQEV
jgi:lipoate-protein ligase A